MKILQIFGAVVAVHLLAFIFIFASPGCSSSPRNVPTPDATLPSGSSTDATVSNNSGVTEMVTPVDHPIYLPEGTPGRVAPTRPGSPNAAALTPAKSSAANVASVVPYTIQKGDSLWIIAKKNHITVPELTKANNLSNNAALKPGAKLMIPVKTPVAAAPTESTLSLSASTSTPQPAAGAPGRPSNEMVKHVVGNGESLGVIARKYGVTVGELAAANNITDPAKIRVGQPLVIPNGKSGGKASTKSTTKPAAPVTGKAPPVAAPRVEQPAIKIEPAPQSPAAVQDLDAGLKDSASADVPTIKIEEPKAEEAAK